MSSESDWLPELFSLNDSGGVWKVYVEEVYAFFYEDFVKVRPLFQGRPVNCRRDPIQDGKEAGFWHCVSEGEDEAERLPDLARCARIKWVRAIIEHWNDDRVDYWIYEKKGRLRHYLWLDESYLVVLEEHARYFILITAFCVGHESYRRKLRKERDECKKKMTPPS